MIADLVSDHENRWEVWNVRLADACCPHCGTCGTILGALCRCDRCGYTFELKKRSTRPSKTKKPRANPKMVFSEVPVVESDQFSRTAIDRGLTRNPYLFIKCQCGSLAKKVSADTYRCQRCGRVIQANYPADWLSRRKKVFRRDGYRCQRCGRSVFADDTPPQCDHIFPELDRDKHALHNLRTLCLRCHLALHPDREVYYWRYHAHYSSRPRHSIPLTKRQISYRNHRAMGGWMRLSLLLVGLIILFVLMQL